MNRNILLTFFLFFAAGITSLQAHSIELQYDEDEDAGYFIYEVKAKETLYGIAKTFGTTPSQIAHANKLQGQAISISQRLLIPFNNEVLMYEKPSNGNYTRVYYTVQRKETVFRICRKYFKINMTAIKEINDLSRNSLDIHQRLTLGYLRNYSPENIEMFRTSDIIASLSKPESKEIESTAPVPNVEPTNVPEPEIYSIGHDNGAAFWKKDMVGLSGHYVLHRFAERNTWIEVTNPMYGTSVRAKVIGNIPSTGYPEDVLIVVSPSIAKDLGALDARFYVKVRYLRAQSTLTKGN